MINAIRQSLMQYENDGKNPTVTSASAPPVYSVQSPVSYVFKICRYTVLVDRVRAIPIYK